MRTGLQPQMYEAYGQTKKTLRDQTSKNNDKILQSADLRPEINCSKFVMVPMPKQVINPSEISILKSRKKLSDAYGQLKVKLRN